MQRIRGFLRQVKIPRRVVGALAVILVLVGLEGVIAGVVTHNALQTLEGIATRDLPLQRGLFEISNLLRDGHAQLRADFQAAEAGSPGAGRAALSFAERALEQAGELNALSEDARIDTLVGLVAYYHDQLAAIVRDMPVWGAGETPPPGWADAQVGRVEAQLAESLTLVRQIGDELIAELQLAAREQLGWGQGAQGASLALAGAILLIAGVVGYVLVDSLVPPLQAVHRDAEAVAAGDLSRRVQVTGQDEIALLGHAFNDMADRVVQLVGALEQRVAERTRDLEIIAEIGREASALRDVDRLLNEAVNLLCTRFGFHHAQVFLLDEVGAYAVLRASTSEAGRALLAQGHKLAADSESVIGQVVARGETVIALDTEDAAVPYRPNPLLPDTRSEMALPLRVGERVIGALDVQSVEPDAFSEQDVHTFRILADQLAVAIGNARLLEEAQARVREIDRLNRRLTRQAWSEFVQEEADALHMGYRYDLSRVAPLTDEGDAGSGNGTDLIVPIRSRGEVIGALRTVSSTQWFSEDEQTVVEAVAERVGVAIENARLFRQTEMALEESRALYQGSELINASMTYEDILLALVQSTALRRADRVSMALFDRVQTGEMARGGWVDVVAVWRRDGLPDPVSSRRYPLEQFPLLDLLRRGEMLVINDTATDARLGVAQRALLDEAFEGRSLAALPFLIGNEWVGFVYAQAASLLAFSAAEIRRIRTLGGQQAALAVQSQLRFQQIETALSETAVLYGASQALSVAESEQEIVDAVAGYAMESGAHAVALSYLEANEAGELAWGEVAASRTVPGAKPVPVGRRFALKRLPLYEQALADSTGLLMVGDILDCAHLDEAGRERALRASGSRAMVLMPLRARGRWIGMVQFDWQEPQTFTERDERIYRALRDQTSVTLDGRRLLVESTQRADDMRFLFDVIQTATLSGGDLESAMGGVASVLRAFFDDAHADILVPDMEKNALRLMACSHATERMGTLYPYSVRTAIGWTATSLESLVLDDASERQRFEDLSAATRSALLIPIAVGEQLMGVIRLQSERERAFDQHTLRLLQTLAGALHAAIQNQRLLQEVTAANEQLLELNKLKSQFLANMSHELRTPLNSIIGFSRVMLKGIDGPLTDLQRQDLETIHGSGQHLLGLINDILDQSKIEAGRMDLNSDYFQISDVIKGVMSTAVAFVKEKPISLIQSIPADLPPVWGDEFRTRQVLLNLVNNASKFTEQGSITVSAEVVTEADGVEMMVVSVTDTGIGIAQKDMDKLFEAFQQVDSSMTRRVGGTGLGLPITRSLVEIQGGRLWVESEVGVGSTFSFSVPLNPLPAQEEEDETAEPTPSLALDTEDKHPSRTVLVLDDEAGVINLYRRYLAHNGYEVVGTTDPDALEDMIGAHHPDLVLLDVMMPNRDGWEVLRGLKARPETRDIPVVVCTIVDERERGLKMGAAGYLVKPFVEEDLLELIEAIAASSADRQEQATIAATE